MYRNFRLTPHGPCKCNRYLTSAHCCECDFSSDVLSFCLSPLPDHQQNRQPGRSGEGAHNRYLNTIENKILVDILGPVSVGMSPVKKVASLSQMARYHVISAPSHLRPVISAPPWPKYPAGYAHHLPFIGHGRAGSGR